MSVSSGREHREKIEAKQDGFSRHRAKQKDGVKIYCSDTGVAEQLSQGLSVLYLHPGARQ